MTSLSKEPSATYAQQRGRFPGRVARWIAGGSLLIVALSRVLPKFDSVPWPLNDPAVGNILTLLFLFIASVTLLIWFCAFSGYSRAIRRVVLLVTGIAVGIALSLFRFEEVDGNMMPRFSARWLPIHDRRLGRIEPTAATKPVDLTTTTVDDFPQFLGPNRDGYLPDPELSRDWSTTPPRLIWRRPIGAGWSAFAAVNGFAVTLEQRGEEEWVTCYDIASGDAVWGHAVNARHENPMGGIGPRSTPTIHSGRVYALGATGILRCLEGATGKLVWQHNLRSRYGLTDKRDEQLVQWGRAASPLVVDNLVVVPAGGEPGKAHSLVAFHAESGEVAWEGGNEQISYASPTLATLGGTRQIVIVNESSVSGHDPKSGRELWQHPWPGNSSGNASASQAAVLPGDRLLVSKGYGGGAELLEFKASGEGVAKPVSVWADRRVLQTKFTNVVVIDGHVYALSEGILECVEPDTGMRKWKKGRYGHGQLLGVGKLMLIVSEEGAVSLVAADPRQWVELGRFEAIEGKTWNNLCLYGKKLLVRNGQEAACYELP